MRYPFLHICLLLSVVICFGLGLGCQDFSYAQQTTVVEANQVSEDSLQRLLDDLEDPQRRQRLKADLQALLASQQAQSPEQDQGLEDSTLVGSLLQTVSQRLQTLNHELARAGKSLLQIPSLLADLGQQAMDPNKLRTWVEMLAKVALLILAALVVERLVRRLLRRARHTFEDRDQDNLGLRGLFFLVRTILELIPIIAFAAAAYGILPLLDPGQTTQLLALSLVNAHVLVRVILVLTKLVLAPGMPALRLLPLDNESVHYLYIWLGRIAGLGIYGYFILEAALLLGLPAELHAFLMKFIGLALTSMIVVLILQNRMDVASWLRGKHPGQLIAPKEEETQPELEFKESKEAQTVGALRRRIADVWHIVAIILVVGLFGTWALEIEGGFQFFAQALLMTGLVLALSSALIKITLRGVDRLFQISDELKTAYPALEARANRYQPVVRNALKIVIIIIAAFAILQAWGLGTLRWLFSPHGGVVVAELLTLIFIIAAAFLIWEFVSAKIEQSLAEEDGQLKKVNTRKLTLLPLLRNVIRISLVLIAGMIVLTHLGINIGPLLAGAGVLGLAIGFGAQTLVRDIITGAFLLMEDSIAVGDWVEVGGHSGGVERLTVRTVTLRDLTGTVHVVPFGDVTSVTNYNREYGYALVDAGVAYRENYGQVVQALQDIALELRQDESWGQEILGELEVFGLNSLSDSAVEIRVRLKTKPLRQFAVRRAFLERMKRVFDERNIEIPFPHRTIWFGTDKDGTAPPMRVMQESRSALAQSAQQESAAQEPDEQSEVQLVSESDVSAEVQQEAEQPDNSQEPSPKKV